MPSALPVITRTALDVETIGAIPLTFGKHDGLTLAEVYVTDPGYLRWLANPPRTKSSREWDKVVGRHRGLQRIGPAAANYLRLMADAET